MEGRFGGNALFVDTNGKRLLVIELTKEVAVPCVQEKRR